MGRIGGGLGHGLVWGSQMGGRGEERRRGRDEVREVGDEAVSGGGA